jgi:acyl dehydratase
VTSRRTVGEVALGEELPVRSFEIDRAALVRYAGASRDFNVIHWNARAASEVGLPDVIAHGMLTMGLAIRTVSDWVRDPGAVRDYQVRFTRPVVVPDPGSAHLQVAAKVSSVEPDGVVRIDLIASVNGQTVLAKARATVQLDS